jgi:RNA polymerase sigma-70 factor (ECF subfamily)
MSSTAVASRGPESIDALLRDFGAPLRGFVARRVASDDVDDLLQEIFLRLAARRDVLDEVEHVSGWLHRVARNAIIDHHRARSRTAANVPGAPEALDEEPAAAADAEPSGHELARCLSPIVERLAEPYRTALLLTDLEGLSQSEAALREGISLSGMKSRVQRAREQLRALVLECCDVELDRRRAVTDFESKRDDCTCRPR